MSVRVLETEGAPYTHSFMDDLESFFWLFFWSVAAHIDSGNRASDKALKALQRLDNDQMDIIAMFKSKILRECSEDEGQRIFDRLEDFDNEWAASPLVFVLILNLGNYFQSEVYSSRKSSYNPSDVFPKVVNMIMDVLSA